MFTKQSGQISTALHQGGIDAALAKTVESLLGQCRAKIEHRGPIDFEYTPPRTITPAIAQHSMPGSRPFEPLSLPRPKKKQPAPPERNTFVPPEHKRNAPEPRDQGPGDGPAGENVNDSQNYEEGDYIKIDQNTREVSLRAEDKPGRRHCVWPGTRNRGNQVHAVKFVGVPDANERGSIKIVERVNETEFALDLKVDLLEVVTGVALDTTATPPELKFSMAQCYVFNLVEQSDNILPLTECATEGSPP